MEEHFFLKRNLMEQMIDAIDKRIALFNFSDENKYMSDKLFEMLGFDEAQSQDFMEDTSRFISYLEQNSVETTNDRKEDCRHFIGIIDKDEKYIIVHLFQSGTENFGFVIDKTVQVYKNLKIREKLLAVQKKSQTDSLTGVLNRNGFEDVARQSLILQPNRGVLCIFDMDNFKLVNDTLGHPVGDKVLKQFSEMLNESFGNIAFVGRIGGDEFVTFIYTELTGKELSEILAAFINKVKSEFEQEYPDIHLSASIGASMADSGINDYASLYKSADTALYKVKQTEKGTYSIV